MKRETALRLGLLLTGEYDLPGSYTVTGVDQFGIPKTEMIPQIDNERLEADLKRLLTEKPFSTFRGDR